MSTINNPHLIMRIIGAFVFLCGNCIADEETALRLEKLAAAVAAGRAQLQTWKGTAEVSQTFATTNEARLTEFGSSHSDGVAQGEPLAGAEVLYRTDFATVEFEYNYKKDETWSHWKSTGPIRFISNTKEREFLESSPIHVDVITILTPKDYYLLDLQSKVVSLEDSTDAGERLALKSAGTRRFGVKNPRSVATGLTERSFAFAAGGLFDVGGSKPEELLLKDAKNQREGKKSGLRIILNPNDDAMVTVSVTYGSNQKNSAPMVINTTYRYINASNAFVESNEGLWLSNKDAPVFSEAWTWEETSGVYLPKTLKRVTYQDTTASISFMREVSLKTSVVNETLDESLFGDVGLKLNDGDLLQTLPSKDVEIKTPHGLEPLKKYLESSTPPPKKESGSFLKLLVVNSIIVCVFLGVVIFKRRRGEKHNN